MINWPKCLIREIARRRAVFFIGSGVSASAKDDNGCTPPTWGEFLDCAKNLINDSTISKEIDDLLAKKNYLLALQAIKDNAENSDYDSLLNTNFNNGKYKASKIHEYIYDMDLNITITTNFDKIYERYCDQNSFDGYKTVTYESEDIGDIIRSDTRLIIKAHGCINSPRGMIFTKSKYHEAKKEHQQFYEILKAIFLTNTCIFVGCGMEDPDILLALEDVKISSSSTFPHYFLTLNGENSHIVMADLEQTYNIKSLEYGPNHVDLEKDLERLKEAVDQFRNTNL